MSNNSKSILERIWKNCFYKLIVSECAYTTCAEQHMTDHNDTSGSEPNEHAAIGSSSRRTFLAASALAGAGAIASTAPAAADEHDDDDDCDDDTEMKETEVQVDAGAGFTVQDIVDNPEGFFVDVHTEEFVPGAIRGQLKGEPGDTQFVVQADGDQVVDGDTGEVGIGDPNGSGLYELDFQPKKNVICFKIAVDVTPPYQSGANTATHIHEAPKGEAGPLRVVFPNPKPNDPDKKQVRKSAGCLPGEFATKTGIMVDVEDARVDKNDVEKTKKYEAKDDETNDDEKNGDTTDDKKDEKDDKKDEHKDDDKKDDDY